MTDVEVPEGFLTFWLPCEPELAPNVEDLATTTTAWALKAGIGGGDDRLASLYANAGVRMTCHFFPYAAGPAQQALAAYNTWAFDFNDRAVPENTSARTCDVVRSINRLARVTRAPRSWVDEGTPYENAMVEVFARMRAHTSDVQYDRFMRAQESCLHSMLWETALREQGTYPSVNEYLAMRIGAVGVYATLGCISVVEDSEPTAQELAAPLTQAAVEAGLLAAGLDNDRYSYSKEAALGQHKYTLHGALQHEHPEMTRLEAMQGAVAIRNRLMALHVELCAQARSDASPALQQYFTHVGLAMSGNAAFGAVALRYLNPAATHPYQLTHIPPPDLAAHEPLPYPTIAWWWDQLDV